MSTKKCRKSRQFIDFAVTICYFKITLKIKKGSDVTYVR